MFHKSSQSSHSRLSRNSRTENLPALAAFNSAPLLDSPTKLEVNNLIESPEPVNFLSPSPVAYSADMCIPLLSMDGKSKLGVGTQTDIISDIYGTGGNLSPSNLFRKDQKNLGNRGQTFYNALSSNLRIPTPMISPRPLDKASTPLLLPRPTLMNKDIISRLPKSLHTAKKLEFKDSSTSAFYVPKSNVERNKGQLPNWSPAPSMVISECSRASPLALSTNPIGYHIGENDKRWENISPMTTNIVSPLPSPRITTELERFSLCTPVSEQVSSGETVFESVGSQSNKTLFHTPLQSLSGSPSLTYSISKETNSAKSKQGEWRQLSSFPRPRSSSRFSPSTSYSAVTSKHRCIEIKGTNRIDSDGAATPIPQNLKGDPHRQAKVKTELCKFYIEGCECPFGSRCNYAHGMDELKYSKVMELQEAGLVSDAYTYRTFPCFSWVSSGACPFGQRCNCIHDPLVAGEHSSWLPHSDVPVANLPQTTVNVEKFCYKQFNSLSQENPLVHDLIWNTRPSTKLELSLENEVVDEEDYVVEWKETYALVSNMRRFGANRKKNTSKPSKNIYELQRLAITFLMSYSSSDAQTSHKDYVYKPNHIVYDELCMVLQTKYFLLVNPKEWQGVDDGTSFKQLLAHFVREISKEEYHSYRNFWNKKSCYRPNDVAMSTELAFGCSGENESKVSLWIDLPIMTSPTQKEIKQHKREKQRQHQTLKKSGNKKITSPFPGDHENGTNSFQNHPYKPFFHMQTHSTTAYNLIQSILIHRIRVLASQVCPSIDNVRLHDEENELKMAFENLKKNAISWHWPASEGRDNVTTETPIPRCQVKYHPTTSSPHATKMWQSFLRNLPATRETVIPEDNAERRKGGLRIFHKLAAGCSDKNDRKLPNIKRFSDSCASRQKPPTGNVAWKSLLHNSPDHRDWQMVQAHYLSSKAPNNTKEKGMPLSPTQGDKNASITY